MHDRLRTINIHSTNWLPYMQYKVYILFTNEAKN